MKILSALWILLLAMQVMAQSDSSVKANPNAAPSISIESGDIRVQFEEQSKKEKAVPLKKPSSGSKVLDFDGVVIEGERQRPGFFLEVKGSDLSIDEVIYSRASFDEYYALEINKAPRVTP